MKTLFLWLVERIGDLAGWVATQAYRIVEQSYYKDSS